MQVLVFVRENYRAEALDDFTKAKIPSMSLILDTDAGPTASLEVPFPKYGTQGYVQHLTTRSSTPMDNLSPFWDGLA